MVRYVKWELFIGRSEIMVISFHLFFIERLRATLMGSRAFDALMLIDRRVYKGALISKMFCFDVL